MMICKTHPTLLYFYDVFRIKRKTSSDRDSDITYEPVDRPVEFTRKISVKGSVQSRLGSNVKSRLGPATNEQVRIFIFMTHQL